MNVAAAGAPLSGRELLELCIAQQRDHEPSCVSGLHFPVVSEAQRFCQIVY